MNERVLSQILLARERFVAYVTLERHGSLVSKFYVQIQTSFSIKRFATSFAVESVLAGVMKDVSFQLSSLNERLAAMLANVRSVAGVRTLVAIQSLASREPSLALKKNIYHSVVKLNETIHDYDCWGVCDLYHYFRLHKTFTRVEESVLTSIKVNLQCSLAIK